MVANLGHPASPAAAAQPLPWQACTEQALSGLQCATFTVPKDYTNPSAGVFDLSVVRAPATGPRSKRIGSLFFNPGGPGVPAVDIAREVVAALPGSIRARFDIVIWDPRGVGRSAGLECQGGTYQLPATGPVDWEAVATQMRTAQEAANRECAAKHPDVVPYISTRATAADLDGLRAAVGDSKLTYWGTSYGTRIGYTYAHDFPNNVRAMLLTSNVDPQATWRSFATGAALAPDTALGFVFDLVPGLQKRYLRAAATLDERTLLLPSGTELTRWTLRGMLSVMSHSQSNVPAIAQYVKAVDTALHSRGAAKRRAIRALDKMTEPLTEMPINGGATAFIGCSDYRDRLAPAEQDALAAGIRAQAPITGFAATQALFFCQGVDVAPNPVPVGFTNWGTPMLVMGSTRDGLTPYAWSVDMARSFRNSRLVTYVGITHTPYLAGSRCVDALGTKYLLTGKRPRVDIACPSTISGP